MVVRKRSFSVRHFAAKAMDLDYISDGDSLLISLVMISISVGLCIYGYTLSSKGLFCIMLIASILFFISMVQDIILYLDSKNTNNKK